MKKHQLGEDVWNFFQAFPSKSKLMCVYFFFVRAFGHFFRGGEWDVRKPPQAFTFRVCDECPFLGGFKHHGFF